MAAGLTAGALLAFCVAGHGQRTFEAKGFKLAEYYGPPHETQMKSLLEGARARPQGESQLFLNDAKLQTFRETGVPELQVQAPECLYHRQAKTASSAGPLRAQTADGRFSIDGEGFLSQQTNSSLMICNRVHTVVEASALDAGSLQTGSAKEAPPGGAIEIRADRFDYRGDTGLGVYEGNVRVSGTNLNLSGGALIIDLPMENRQLQSITTTTNVAVDYGGVHAAGQRAVYTVTNGLLHVLGNPSWRAEQREGGAEELVIDRTNRIFQANGQAWLRLPGQSLGSSGFLTRSNAPTAASTTNRFLELSSGNYEFRTNAAYFRDKVRLRENLAGLDRGKLSSELLTAHFAGSNQLQQLVAEKHVVIEQETNRFTAERAVYTGTNGLLELTQNPTWRSGVREGKGDLIRLDTPHEELLVRGKASLRMPAAELIDVKPAAPGTPGKERTRTGSSLFAEIFCNEYSLRPDLGMFRGGVYATHPQMNWACESLTVRSSTNHGQVEQLIADGGVVFDLRDEKGQKVHGKGDKAVYTYTIHDNVTNDVLNLTGSPALLESTSGTVTNNLIILDRANNTLVARGDYQVRGTTRLVDTNFFRPRLTK